MLLRFGLRLHGLRLRRTLQLLLALLPLWGTLLASLVLAAAPAAPVPLRLPLAIRWGRPHLYRGLRRFCCHACTSWHLAMGCFALPDPARAVGAMPRPDACRLSIAGLLLSRRRNPNLPEPVKIGWGSLLGRNLSRIP